MEHPIESVYFISDGNFVKIGKTSNIKQRFRDIQVANPKKLTLLHVVEGNENILQSLFTKYHERGEWYRIEDKLSDFLFCKELHEEILDFCWSIMEYGIYEAVGMNSK